jgi:hypothetical protein
MKLSTKASLALWKRRLAYRQKKVDYYRGEAKSGDGAATKGTVTADEAQLIHKWEKLRDEAKNKVAVLEAASSSLQDRAYKVAESLIGVMEQGGNNRGPVVSKIITGNGGMIGEAWCGDFQAYCYRHAGSKAVNRSWASVYYLGRLSGVVKTTKPVRGDLVRFNFSHVGMYVRDLGGGYIETIEGNTGRSGAVSDSSTGGDGVYRKRRTKNLVEDYRHITR